MKLVEFTRFTGTKFSLNPDFVTYVTRSEGGNANIAIPSGTVFSVTESYDDVIRMLTGQSTGRKQ